ncbi:DUF4388 domain-containing protein [candidate division GN15 bacterium]|nr:DUF4388 domain-containing protein [candidate division GN15 bacterium]
MEKPTNLRLDEILVFEGLVTEDQVREALAHQREHGGKIGSHLMRAGHITESGLVKALSTQFDCDGVVLTNMEIPDEVLGMVPPDVALARRVLPFDYNEEHSILKVACEDPKDERLMNELQFVAQGKTIKLFVAAEISLKSAIARHYMAYATSNQLTESGSLPIAETILAETPAGPSLGDQRRPARGQVLLVTDDYGEGDRMQALLEQQSYRVARTDSADDAIDLIGAEEFSTVFIKDTVPGDYIDLIDRLRKISPKTNVRYFESAAKLLIDRDSSATEADLLVRNLDLYTSLLASRNADDTNHSHVVGQHVEGLCRQLGLPTKERLLITTAAYLHDLAKYYYNASDVPADPRGQIDLTIKLLDSISYSPVVIEILRSMYINLRAKYTKRLPIEVLGGNIVTIVDIFCDNVKVNEKLSLDKFEAIRRKFDELTGKLFLAEVVNAFVDMIQREVLKTQKEVKFGQVMIFGEDKKDLGRVERHLQVEGFRTLSHTKYRAFVDLFQRSRPNMLILMASKGPSQVISMVDDLTNLGVDVDELPTFILAKASVAPSLTSLFERGIEDLIVLDESLDLLVVKMKKIRDRLEQDASRSRNGTNGGSHGTLKDMNLIDLLQAMGPSRKTAKLVISSADGIDLTMYLEHGQIMNAECNGKTGAEAVYEGLAWTDGSWMIEPVSSDSLPEANNQLSNESILMEGCRLLDEAQLGETGPIEDLPQ